MDGGTVPASQQPKHLRHSVMFSCKAARVHHTMYQDTVQSTKTLHVTPEQHTGKYRHGRSGAACASVVAY